MSIDVFRHLSLNLNLPLPLLLGWVAALRVILVVGMNLMGSWWEVLRLGEWVFGFSSRMISPIDVCLFFVISYFHKYLTHKLSI